MLRPATPFANHYFSRSFPENRKTAFVPPSEDADIAQTSTCLSSSHRSLADDWQETSERMAPRSVI